MNPEAGDSTGKPAADPEMGQPIHLLKEQGLETSPRFVARVRGRIYRRTAASQFASYSWHLPKMALVEMARLLSHLFRTIGTNKEP